MKILAVDFINHGDKQQQFAIRVSGSEVLYSVVTGVSPSVDTGVRESYNLQPGIFPIHDLASIHARRGFLTTTGFSLGLNLLHACVEGRALCRITTKRWRGLHRAH